MAELHVTGLAEIQKLLDTLPAKLSANIMRGALRAGCNVIKETAKQMAPVGPPSVKGAKQYGGYAGALRDSIRVGAKIKGGKVTAYVKAGGNSKKGADVFYAHMLEYGFRPVGVHKQPFMRPALDSQASAAIVAAAEYMKARLSTKQGLDTADINIGVEE